MFYREVIFDEEVVFESSFPAFYTLNGKKSFIGVKTNILMKNSFL